MSYPVLRLTKTYARVEVRKGTGAVSWDKMKVIHSGPAKAGMEWKGGEGEKLSGAHGDWPDNPDGKLSLPYTVSGKKGLSKGKPVLKKFP